ncbi:MAG: biotin--[acetyl-CoA-carboxylase] ligase [Halobacteriales archaeon]|nr:biotin--[acetyl-CoA-carboxylase] ligase [Halobacteriales archaeon]
MLSPRRRAVLAALVKGPVEPAALGERLELPGTAVVSHVDGLREHGFVVERGPDGFVLESIPEYGYGVQAGLEARFVIDYRERVGSTNDRARELAERGETDVAVLADEQTGGRGRLDRAWASPPGGIYCSLLFRPLLQPDELGLLSLAAGAAAVEAAAAAGVDAACKWPNDLQGPDGRKLAGVLAESATGGGAVEWAVVGLGLNANVDPDDLPPEGTSLQALAGDPVDRRAVTQAYLEAFDAFRGTPETIVDAWRERSTTLGQEVWVRTGGEELVGVAADVDEAGALLVETDSGTRRVAAGDCEHLRPTADR